MTEPSNGGAAGKPEVVEVDLQDPAVAARFAHLGAICESYLAVFVPYAHEKLTVEALRALVLGILREEMMIDAQVRPLFEMASAKENPLLILELVVPGTPRPIRFQAKRRLEHCKNPQEVLAQALLVSFTNAPGVRAVLRIMGMNYMWLAPTQSRIVLA